MSDVGTSLKLSWDLKFYFLPIIMYGLAYIAYLFVMQYVSYLLDAEISNQIKLLKNEHITSF